MSALLRRVEGGGDLGTANIAIVVLDEDNQPVAGVMYPSNVVKDGVVVDYLTASRVVARLKQILEQKQGCTLERAAIAVPPGISEGNTKVIVNVVELAGFIVTQVLDEPVAAASALNIKNGAVVDVGGGTTGMSILKSGKVTFSADEPTGGSHMKLVIAGALGLPYAEAEEMKKNGWLESSAEEHARFVADKFQTKDIQEVTEQVTEQVVKKKLGRPPKNK